MKKVSGVKIKKLLITFPQTCTSPRYYIAFRYTMSMIVNMTVEYISILIAYLQEKLTVYGRKVPEDDLRISLWLFVRSWLSYIFFVFVCLILFDLMLYVHGKKLRSCWDSQLLNHNVPGQASS